MYGIYANIGGILMVNVTIYIAYMDPMGNYIILLYMYTLFLLYHIMLSYIWFDYFILYFIILLHRCMYTNYVY